MFIYVQKPTPYANATARPAPAPFRSDYWDHAVRHGFSDDYVPALSTKSAVYSGILATQVRLQEPICRTANCTWPITPSLAVCGECVTVPVTTDCVEATQICTYGMAPHMNVTVPSADDADIFKVSPSNKQHHGNATHNHTYVSIFDIMTVAKREEETRTTGAECALWVCMQSYRISVSNGNVKQNIVGIWNQTRFEPETSAHLDEFVFIDIPKSMNTQNYSRYSVSRKSIKALRDFMDGITDGSFEYSSDQNSFSSDWIEAMWQATTDLQTWIGKLALSLTNEIREHGTVRDALRSEYEGQATKMADYIHVQWFWMIYPPAFLLISLYYLVNTVIAAARDDVAVWKSDSLPMLFSRIDRRIMALGADKMEIPKGLDDLGKSKVALTKDRHGHWVFEASHETEQDEKIDQQMRIV